MAILVDEEQRENEGPGATIAELAGMALEQRPPEKQSGGKKADVLGGVNGVATQSGVEQARRVPNPERERMEEPGSERSREEEPR